MRRRGCGRADTIYAFYDHHITTHIMRELRGDYTMGPTPTPELKKPDATVLSMEKLLTLNPDVISSNSDLRVRTSAMLRARVV